MAVVEKVTVELTFVAKLAEGPDGDADADRIGDTIVKILQEHPVQIPGVAHGSFKIGGWSSEPVPDEAGT